MATERASEPRARRRARRAARRAGNSDADMLLELPEPVVDRQLVATALGRLTQEHRDVLRECYFRRRSVAQAARALEIAPDVVRSRAYYALRALRLAIDELGGVQ